MEAWQAKLRSRKKRHSPQTDPAYARANSSIEAAPEPEKVNQTQ